MEACGGAYYWARVIEGLGHRVRLMPPAYVKPYVKRGKTDAAAAEAICEAVTRPTMRFAPPKTEAQQAAGTKLKVRQMLVQQRTRTVNALRSHLAEFGGVAAKGMGKVADLIAILRDDDGQRLPPAAREALLELAGQIEALEERIGRLETGMVRRSRTDETARRLATIPGIGAITAIALQAMVPDPKAFQSGRHFAASLGLTRGRIPAAERKARADLQARQRDAALAPGARRHGPP
jgi:transposase